MGFSPSRVLRREPCQPSQRTFLDLCALILPAWRATLDPKSFPFQPMASSPGDFLQSEEKAINAWGSKRTCMFHLVIIFIYPSEMYNKTRARPWKSKDHSALPVLREKGPGDHQLREPEGSKQLAGQESPTETREARRQDKFPHINPRDSLLPLFSPENLLKPLPNTARGRPEEGQRKEAS